MSEPALRWVLLAIGAFHLALGLLGTVAPRTFFDEIGQYAPYNGHYVGDNAAFYFAAGAGLLVSAYRPSWRVPMLVVGAIWYGLHALNHLLDVEEARSDARGVFDTVALAFGSAVSAWLARIASRMPAR